MLLYSKDSKLLLKYILIVHFLHLYLLIIRVVTHTHTHTHTPIRWVYMGLMETFHMHNVFFFSVCFLFLLYKLFGPPTLTLHLNLPITENCLHFKNII